MDERRTRRCGALAQPDGSVRWRVWAPKARQVDLVLLDGDHRRVQPLGPEAEGYFTALEPDVRDGQRYAYRLDGGPERPDPASRWQPDGVHAPSAVVRTDRFSWSDQGWKGVRLSDLVFYELHVGTFTPEGTFEAIVPRLHGLRRLGITAVEFMPVAQFPGTRNWGYDGVHPYAVQNSYGGPQGLQRLVDACHAAGLAVFLDVVYNHLGPEGNYLAEFGPYFTDRYRTFWGPALNYDDAGCDAVRDFVVDNARMWLEEFHIDGLRLDAVHAMFDFSPVHILREIKEAADDVGRRAGRSIQVIAESDLNDVRLLLPPERGGLGLDAQWSDDFHHTVHAYLTREQQGYYQDFGQAQYFAKVFQDTFVYAGKYSKSRRRRHGAPVGDLSGDRFVVSIQNHDQIGNRALGERLDVLLTPPARRLAASLLLVSPHLPLLFMGEEYGEERPFLFFCSFGDPRLQQAVREGRRREFEAFDWKREVPDPQSEQTFAASRLTWSWPEGSRQAGMRHLYADLLAARRAWPALADFTHRTVRLLSRGDTATVLEMIRGAPGEEAGTTAQVYCNLTDERQLLPPGAGDSAKLLFTSEARRYGGPRQDAGPGRELLPFECVVFGPAAWERFD
jgi:maltooligosyltrehalose trehalohydrolase